MKIKYEKQNSETLELLHTAEKKLKEIEKLNFNARKKISSLQKEIECKEKTISDLKLDKNVYEEKIELLSLLILRIFGFIENLFSKNSSNSISLQYMNLTDSFMPTLSRIIELSPQIEVIDLEGNEISDEGISQFTHTLSTCIGNLQQINLSFNKISAKGAWELLRALQSRESSHGKSMKCITLSYNILEEYELYLKAWEATKEIRANYPTIKTKKSDFIEASSTTLDKLFRNLCDKMFDNKDVKQITYLLGKFEVKQDTEENLELLCVRNKREIYNSFKSENNTIMQQRLLKARISRLSVKKAKLKEIEYPRDLDITLLMAQRPAFVLSYIRKSLEHGLKIDAIDLKLDETLLMYASRTNNLNLCKLLISKLASPEVKNVSFR